MAMPASVPIGRATKASASKAKAYKVPCSRSANGKNTAGKTSTEAMPKTKKSKYSEARPITTPTAMSPGAASASSGELSGVAPWAPAREERGEVRVTVAEKVMGTAKRKPGKPGAPLDKLSNG